LASKEPGTRRRWEDPVQIRDMLIHIVEQLRGPRGWPAAREEN
jgi:hypothetical protein